MTILLSHTTALECLRGASIRGIRPAYADIRQLPDAAPTAGALKDLAYDLRDSLGFEKKVDYLVAKGEARGRPSWGKGHVWSSPLPEGAFLSFGEELVVSSPEFIFLQMAGTLSLVQLAQLGFELCGGYAIWPKSRRGLERRDEPLTDPLKLAAFLARTEGCYGHKKACRALRWVMPNSWSPMETDIALLLCLPTQMGGYQFPFPELNRKVDLDRPYRGRADNDRCFLDLSWNRGSVALEFNGEEDHSGRVREGRDRSREIALAQQGVDLTVITSYHVFRLEEFDLLAQALSKKLGRKFPRQRPEVANARCRLRASLFARFDGNMLIA